MDSGSSTVDNIAETKIDRLTLLREARDRLREALGDPMTPRASLAPLSKELREITREIDAIPGSGEVVPLDEIAGGIADDLAERRAERLAERQRRAAAG